MFQRFRIINSGRFNDRSKERRKHEGRMGKNAQIQTTTLCMFRLNWIYNFVMMNNCNHCTTPTY